MTYILDTNIISALLKGNVAVMHRLAEQVRNGENVLINAITYYELKRGLIAINSVRRLRIFEEFCQAYSIAYIDSISILNLAAEIYANLSNSAQLVEDADILIGAIALNNNSILVTDDAHFVRINGLKIENWLN